jgi:uncharacterized protein (TIGR02118 family)
MTKLVVMYPKPKDPAHFASYFRDKHMPLVKKMPGLRRSSFGPATGPDGQDGAFFWLFAGDFDSAQALNDALSSSEGQAAVADIPNYAPDYPPTILVVETTEA